MGQWWVGYFTLCGQCPPPEKKRWHKTIDVEAGRRQRALSEPWAGETSVTSGTGQELGRVWENESRSGAAESVRKRVGGPR